MRSNLRPTSQASKKPIKAPIVKNPIVAIKASLIVIIFLTTPPLTRLDIYQNHFYNQKCHSRYWPPGMKENHPEKKPVKKTRN